MRRLPIWLLLALFVGASVAEATIYRWIDEDGTVHYSDRPRPGAERYDPRAPSEYAPVERRPAPGDDVDDAVAEEPEGYDRFAILSPTEDQVIWDNRGNVTVQLALEPALRVGEGHRVRVHAVSADGPEFGPEESRTNRVQFTGMYRGTYTLSAAVVDAGGRVIERASEVTFHLRQHSAQSRPAPEVSAP